MLDIITKLDYSPDMKQLDNETKSNLLFALSPEEPTDYQRRVAEVIRYAVKVSDDSDELIDFLVEGQIAFADAIKLIRAELKLKKGNVIMDNRKVS